MRCIEFEARIQRLLDSRQSLIDDPSLLDHAMACAGCAAKLEVYGELFDQLARWQPPALDKDFSQCTVRMAFPDAVAARSATPSAERRHWQGVLAPLACLVLLAATAGFWFASISNETSTVDSVVSGSQTLGIAVVQHEPSVSGERTMVATPDSKDPQTTDRWLVFWTEWSALLGAEPLESLDNWTQGIKPVAASLNTAWDSLRTTFPLYESPSDLVAPEDAA